jgi:hypothetical protein
LRSRRQGRCPSRCSWFRADAAAIEGARLLDRTEDKDGRRSRG